MSNPFGKKNPFLSMWLSGAHSVAARMRGQATAEVKRQANAAAKKVTKDATDMWANALLPKAAKRTRKRR
jgi:ethanolamine utilization microcompartment shell protein EutL